MRLRQAVCHPLLLLKITQAAVDAEEALGGVSSSNNRIKKLITQFHHGAGGSESDDEEMEGDSKTKRSSLVDAVAKLQQLLKEREADDPSSSQDNACPLCFEEDKAEECYMACGHSACKHCLIEYLQSCENEDREATCPTCREGPIYEQDLVEKVKTRQRKNKFAAAINGEQEEEGIEIPLSQTSTGSQPAEFFQKNDFRSSTKLEALVSDLNQLRYDEPGFKGVIFSQFTTFLDLVEVSSRPFMNRFWIILLMIDSRYLHFSFRSFSLVTSIPSSGWMELSLRSTESVFSTNSRARTRVWSF